MFIPVYLYLFYENKSNPEPNARKTIIRSNDFSKKNSLLMDNICLDLRPSVVFRVVPAAVSGKNYIGKLSLHAVIL